MEIRKDNTDNISLAVQLQQRHIIGSFEYSLVSGENSKDPLNVLCVGVPQRYCQAMEEALRQAKSNSVLIVSTVYVKDFFSIRNLLLTGQISLVFLHQSYWKRRTNIYGRNWWQGLNQSIEEQGLPPFKLVLGVWNEQQVFLNTFLGIARAFDSD